MRFNFAEWLKNEMTSTTSVSGGGTYTNDIAQFARPLFSGEPIKRKYPNLITNDERIKPISRGNRK